MIEPKPFRTGLIGLGAMGARIATRLVREGFNPTVYDVADVSVRMFTNDVGGMLSASPKMVGQCSDIVITVLASEADLHEVLFGWQGLATGLARGGVLIDMGSANPRATPALARRLAERGIEMIDAPALGTLSDARAGQLRLIVGGDPATVERCRPILAALASRLVHAGPAGSGQAAAALGDFMRGAGLLAACEALRIGQRSGFDPEMLIAVAEQQGGAGAWLADALRTEVLTRSFNSGLALGHVLRSVELSDAMARAAGVHAPLLAACLTAWTEARDAIGSGADQTELPRWLESTQRATAKQKTAGETADDRGAGSV